MQKTMEQPEKIFPNLFTSGFVVREEGKSTGRRVTFPKAKEKYAEYLLNSKWQEICGEHLGKHCFAQKINGNELTICVANSLLANELFMMKGLFLQKINSQLAGYAIIKKINFQVNSKAQNKSQAKESIIEENTEVVRKNKICPKCGVVVQTDAELCDVCTREEKNILKYKLAELLKVQPWLKYEECQTYYKCDKILFNAVKDSVQNIFFEKVRLNTADEYDCQMAVMFLTGKPPTEINDKIYGNSLAYLRRNQSVFTSGFRLHGKKQ